MFYLFEVDGLSSCSVELQRRGGCRITESRVSIDIARKIEGILASEENYSILEYTKDGDSYFIVPIMDSSNNPCGYVWQKQNKNNRYFYSGVELSGVGAVAFNIMGNPAAIWGYLQVGENSTSVNSLNGTIIDSSAIDILRALRGDGKPFCVHNDPDVDLAAMADMIDKRVAKL